VATLFNSRLRKFRFYALFLIFVALPVTCFLVLFSYSEQLFDTPKHRRLTFITVNDTYMLGGAAEGEAGGLDRLRTLRKNIERDAPEAILLHAGDFLAPSLISRVFKGEHMINVLNNLDGDDQAFDKRMFVVFGNHEFDDSKCGEKYAPLNDRVAESKFTWLNSNLDFSNCTGMKSIANQGNVKKDSGILLVNGVKLGLFGIGLTPDKMNNIDSSRDFPAYENEISSAKTRIAHLRLEGAEFIVGITHLPKEDDEKLIEELASEGLGLLIGGHDHTNMILPDKDGVGRGFKADFDAQSAWRIDVDLSGVGKPVIKGKRFDLDARVPPDPKLAALAKSWSVRAETRICKEQMGSDDPNCLAVTIGRTQAPLEVEDSANRTQETGFGDWLADEVLNKVEADIVILNAGSFSRNANLKQGEVKLRHLYEIFRYDNAIAVRPFPASKVCEALVHGFGSPGRGAWPHTAGVEIDIEGPPGAASPVRVRRFVKRPDLSCDSNEEIKVAALAYVLCGNDGYPFWPKEVARSDECTDKLNEKPLLNLAERYGLREVAKKAIEAARSDGIQPKNKGRVRFNVGAVKK
jgi:5'-nucleotidase